MRRSVPQIPHRPTRRTSSPTPGAGSARDSITKDLPGALKTAAFISGAAHPLPSRNSKVICLDVLRELAPDTRARQSECLRQIAMRRLLGDGLILQPGSHARPHLGHQFQVKICVYLVDDAQGIGMKLAKIDVVESLGATIAKGLG